MDEKEKLNILRTEVLPHIKNHVYADPFVKPVDRNLAKVSLYFLIEVMESPTY